MTEPQHIHAPDQATNTNDGATDSDKQNKNKEKRKPFRRRSPGYTARPHRMACELALLRLKVKRAHPDWDSEDIEAEANRRLVELLPSDPQDRKQYEATAPISTCPDRETINQLVEVAAIRRLPGGRAFEDLLTNCEDGRPSDRVLSVTTFERAVWENGRPELWRGLTQLHTDYRLLHWAYDWPVSRASDQHYTNVYKTLKASLDRNSHEHCIAINLAAIRELAELTGCEDIGRWVALDGTDIPLNREQRGHDPAFPEEDEILRGGLELAGFSKHGHEHTKKFWRGPALIVLVCVLTGLPLAWIVKSGEEPEHRYLDELLDTCFRHWPEWTPEALIADAHFDNEKTHRLCEERYGIHPVFARFGEVDEKFEWATNEGTPKCAVHGDMRLVRSEGFVDVAARRKRGMDPGDFADLSKAAFRWECCDEPEEGEQPCPVSARTMWKHNPRLYTFLPRRGVHKKRVSLRRALMTRRQIIESVNAQIKGMGIGLRGQSVARWTSSDSQVRWLLSGTLLGLTLRRLAHESGLYAEVHQEADELGLLSASVPSEAELQAAQERLKAPAENLAA